MKTVLDTEAKVSKGKLGTNKAYKYKRKISNRILVSQTQPFIKRIMYRDQVDFILGMEAWFNTASPSAQHTI